MPYKRNDIGKRVDEDRRRAGSAEQHRRSCRCRTFDDELRYRVARAIYGNPSFWNYAAMANPPIHIIVENGRRDADRSGEQQRRADAGAIARDGAGRALGRVTSCAPTPRCAADSRATVAVGLSCRPCGIVQPDDQHRGGGRRRQTRRRTARACDRESTGGPSDFDRRRAGRRADRSAAAPTSRMLPRLTALARCVSSRARCARRCGSAGAAGTRRARWPFQPSSCSVPGFSADAPTVCR